MRRIVAVFAIVLACATSVLAQSNTVVFDNQSSEPALVKLIGPTSKEIEVPTGSKATVTAAAGHYYIKVRYGVSGNFRYAKGEEFDVTETATARSETTITLHKVIAGNYASQPSTQSEFEADGQLEGRSTEGDTPHVTRAEGGGRGKDSAQQAPALKPSSLQAAIKTVVSRNDVVLVVAPPPSPHDGHTDVFFAFASASVASTEGDDLVLRDGARLVIGNVSRGDVQPEKVARKLLGATVSDGALPTDCFDGICLNGMAATVGKFKKVDPKTGEISDDTFKRISHPSLVLAQPCSSLPHWRCTP